MPDLEVTILASLESTSTMFVRMFSCEFWVSSLIQRCDTHFVSKEGNGCNEGASSGCRSGQKKDRGREQGDCVTVVVLKALVLNYWVRQPAGSRFLMIYYTLNSQTVEWFSEIVLENVAMQVACVVFHKVLYSWLSTTVGGKSSTHVRGDPGAEHRVVVDRRVHPVAL